jgi:hypothetical protein
MCRFHDNVTARIADLPLAEDVRRAIGKLTSLHNGDAGVIEAIACGRRAIPALRAVVFNREPSGLYETRRRAVEALARLQAVDVLIDYLRTPRQVTDPVEQTGEEAVMNAAARALAESCDARVVPVLLELSERRPLTGVVDALGKLRRVEALPYFIRALAEDFTRPAAEAAIRNLGWQARGVLLETAILRSPSDAPETESTRRCRRSALGLFAELGSPAAEQWPVLHDLMRDEEPKIAALVCEICLASAAEHVKVAAVLRLIDLLSSADWLLSAKIEDCLVKHFDTAKRIIVDILQHSVIRADPESPTNRTAHALLRVATRTASDARRGTMN